MNNVVAIRVEQKLVWDESSDRYDAGGWTLVYMVEGDVAWRKIPILTTYRGGPQDGLSQIVDEITSEKEK